MPWYEIKDKADGSADVFIYEQIGEDFWGEGVTAKAFVQELAALSVRAIALHINSPGGSVFDGQAIYNAVAAHPAVVTAYVDGVAASIASVIALAGDRVVMARNALFMIHDPYMPVAGTAEDHRKAADLLDAISGTIVTAYQEKSGQPVEAITAAMAAETWYTAEQALAFGFVDEIAEPLKAAAGYQVFDFEARGFRNGPRKAVVPALEEGLTAQDAIAVAQVAQNNSTAAPAAESGTTATAAEAKPARKLVLAGNRIVSFTKEKP
jgi:ATP-dependent Clp protease protease subunit